MTTDATHHTRVAWTPHAIRVDHRHPARRIDAIAGPVVWWAMHLGGSYWLVPRMCEYTGTWPKHALTAAMLLLTFRAGLSAVQLGRAARRQPDSIGASRDQWLGWTGLAMAIFFGAVTAAEWLPVLYVDPCH